MDLPCSFIFKLYCYCVIIELQWETDIIAPLVSFTTMLSNIKLVPCFYCGSLKPSISLSLSGSLDLSQRHAGGHLRPPEQTGLQRPPGVPPGQWRLPALARGGVPDHALRTRRPHLPHRRERGHPLLRGVRFTGSHPGRWGHRYTW